MQITNAMIRNPVTIRSDDALAKAKSLMKSYGFRRLPVVDDGQLVGIITERDLREHAGHLENTRVNAVMRTALVTIAPEDTVEEAARLMLKHKIGGLPDRGGRWKAGRNCHDERSSGGVSPRAASDRTNREKMILPEAEVWI